MMILTLYFQELLPDEVISHFKSKIKAQNRDKDILYFENEIKEALEEEEELDWNLLIPRGLIF